MRVLACCVLFLAPCLAQPDYLLHPGESILIHVSQTSQINGQTLKIQSDGFVTLPSLGRIRASGMTVKTLEKQIADRLKQGPDVPRVAITVVTLHPPNP